MAKVHVTRKELKKDALQEAGLSFLEYWDNHWQKILWVAIAIVVLFAAFRIGVSVVNKRRAEAAAMLVRAQQEVQTASLAPDPQQQQELLKLAIDHAEDVQKRYSSSPSGIEALYIKANALFVKQDYDQAVSLYQNYAERAKTNADKAKAYIGMAYAKENKYFLAPQSDELLQQAIDYYTKARDLATDKDGKHSYLAYQALLGIGRLYEAKGDTAKAIQLYKTVLNDRALAAELKPPKADGEKEIDPEDREARLKEIRNEIRRIRAQFSFEQAAQSNLQELGIPTDEATTQTKTK